MTKPTGGWGRGLGALLPPKIAPAPETEAGHAVAVGTSEIDVDAIVANPHQPRKYFSPSDLEDLLASIKEHGIIQPLVVTKMANGTYELIAGERRLRASRMLGLKTVPAVVRTANEQEKLELAIIENIQRQNLNAVEEALAYQSMIDQFSLKHDEVATKVGKSRSYVTNTTRLLELDDRMLDALSAGKISRSHARTLLAEKDLDKREALFDQIMNGKMTVREAEARAGKKSVIKKGGKDPNVLALEAELREALGTKVQLDMKGSTGKITVHFYSKDDLKELIEKLKK